MKSPTLLVLNPNRSRAMTDAVVAAVGRTLPADIELVGWTASTGPPVIRDQATFDAAAAALPALLAEAPRADAVLLACFGDPGLAWLRAHAGVPVIGLAEAAIARAQRLGEPFCLLTAGPAWVPILERCVADAGASDGLRGVLALDRDGAALRADPARARAEILALSQEAVRRGARRLILGGAAFEGLDLTFADGLRIDRPVDAAVARLLAGLLTARGCSPA